MKMFLFFCNIIARKKEYSIEVVKFHDFEIQSYHREMFISSF